MSQKPTTNIQIFSHGGNYEKGKCICISENVGNSDTNRQIVFMTQSNFTSNKNRHVFSRANMQGFPKYVFRDYIAPARLELKRYL